jgi:hypothetical protein
MRTVVAENRIIGPNPLAQVPGISNAPEIGIPVNAAIAMAPDNRPNLHIINNSMDRTLRQFFQQEISLRSIQAPS